MNSRPTFLKEWPAPCVAESGMRITVCICTYNRDPHLKRLLESLQGIQLGAPDEQQVRILVVDNNASAATRQLCADAGRHLPVPLHYVDELKPGVVSSRNRAVMEVIANGDDFLAFLDDDDVPDNDWLRELLRAQAHTGADIVAGNRRLMDPPPWTQGVGERRKKKSSDKQLGSHRIPRSAGTGNVLIGRGVLLALVGNGPVFHPAFNLSGGEDKDFFLRAIKNGTTMAFAEKSFITQYHDQQRYTAEGVVARGFKSGCSKMNVTRCHGSWSERLSLIGGALTKLLTSIIFLPFVVFTRKQRLGYLYRMGKSLGILYFFLTGKSAKYYYHEHS